MFPSSNDCLRKKLFDFEFLVSVKTVDLFKLSVSLMNKSLF